MTRAERLILRATAVVLGLWLLVSAVWYGWLLAQQTIVSLITLERRAVVAESRAQAAEAEVTRLKAAVPTESKPAVPVKPTNAKP